MLSYLPQRCPQDRRWQCAELLTRINYGMALGGFQMELETGKVVYKTSYSFKEGNFEKDLFGDLLKQNIDVMDHFMPAIGWVALSRTTAVSALDRLDRQWKEAEAKQVKLKGRKKRTFQNN